MTLTMTVLKGPETPPGPLPHGLTHWPKPGERRVAEEGGFSIGRGSENDLVLADPDRVLSKRHCQLSRLGDAWVVNDLSANGTFCNEEEDPLGSEAPRTLQDGDRLRLGAYEIGIRIGERRAEPRPAADLESKSLESRGWDSNGGTSEGGLLVAFLEGAQMEHHVPDNPARTMHMLGRALRATVTGLRAVLAARSQIKGEFRIEQTMVRAHGNNPLKFSTDDDAALTALLGTARAAERGSNMDAVAAIDDALRDLRLHELATVSAMQAAVRALIDRFDPARMRDESVGRTVLPAQRKARAWDAFERLHEETRRALGDDFDSVFGKAFARAYEQALREAREQDVPTAHDQEK